MFYLRLGLKQKSMHMAGCTVIDTVHPKSIIKLSYKNIV
ncbi:hypothetical protein CSC12_6163 (plasmid) [Klebsiella michiganensis]|nr:hypothetical protein CSC12_6163 [Klebsiella michiganensis]